MPTSLPTDSRRIVSGDEANERVRALAERRRSGNFGAGENVTFGWQYLDDNIPPQMRGELSVLLGLTSHGKTLAIATIAKHILDTLGNSGNRGLLIVMTEETVEARQVQMWGDSQVTIRSVLTGKASLERIDYNIQKSSGKPVFYLGSTTELDDVGGSDGLIRPSTISDGINQLLRMGVEPEYLIIDHLHDMEPDRTYHDEAQRYEWVGDGIKQLCNALGRICPTLAVGQVKKDVENRPPLESLPNTYDIKYMQNLIARCSNVYSITYPQRNRGIGLRFPTAHGEVLATKGTFLFHVAKTRYGTCAGETVAMTALDDDGNWSNQLRAMPGLL